MKQQGKIVLASLVCGAAAGAGALKSIEAVLWPPREPDAILKSALTSVERANQLNSALLRRVAAEELPELNDRSFNGERFALTDTELLRMAAEVDLSNSKLREELRRSGLKEDPLSLTNIVPKKNSPSDIAR